ncbi:MAG: hypothetical protein P1U56_10415 [Saprospiraceae bacterium]|nr:hypothetical protein [Saprospiraceae bacterium]
MRALIFIAVIWAFSLISYAQETNALDEIKFYADVIANAGNPVHREKANDEFSTLFDAWIRSESFNYPDLESIQWLSVKKPDDLSFTVITWQLLIDDNTNKYFGYLLKDDAIFPLTETNFVDDLEYDVLSDKEWAGALYYNIHTVNKNNKNHYILFGYNAFKDYEHRKIADVLTFGMDGAPIFGAELFKKQDPGERGVIKNRLILDYSSDANASLNYNPGLNMIVFDHLIPRMGRISGQGPTMLPDGSYVGYTWDGTYFNYVDKIYTQTQDTPPMPKPVINDSKNQNIFGKKKKKN